MNGGPLRSALKEWAVGIRALREGRQVLLLRKGGLRDANGEFALESPTTLVEVRGGPVVVEATFVRGGAPLGGCRVFEAGAYRETGPDGTFTLTTYDAADGAPAGEYRVTVELWRSTGRGDEGPTNRLNPKYARPESSGLTATVSAGPTDLKPITLKN